nr:reverse transcriptase domain-containing protein [Tanacetum cinerariifolium]
MRTRSQSRNNFAQQEASPAIVEPLRIELPFLKDQFQEDPPEDPPEVPMADNRTMAELLQAPTEGYEDAIVIPEIAANNFELKHGLINLVQNKQFFGHDKEDPHAHIRYFNKITYTMSVPNVPSLSIKLMLFPFSLEGAARIWLEKEPPRSILTWDDLVTKFINQFFPPSKTTNLRNEITRFQQIFDESFYEAWERFNDLLRACPHHVFFELHQLNTFYNTLNVNDQDSLNSATGGNFLDKMPRECLKIIESKSKVRQSRAKAVVAKVSTSSSTPAISSEVSKLKDMVRALLLDKKNQSSALASSSTPATVKAIEPNCVTYGANYNKGNTCFRPQMVANQIRPPGFPPHQNNQNNFNRGNNFNQNQGGNFNQSNFNQGGNFNQGQLHRPQGQGHSLVIPLLTQRFKGYHYPKGCCLSRTTNSYFVQSCETRNRVSVLMPNLKPSIPYPLRRDNKRRRDRANEQTKKFYEIFKDMSFEISFTDALILMPKFASTLKALIGNKEKLSEMARTSMNEHCSAVILNKLPRKLRDPGKFLIPCEFLGMDECLALADLSASINLMPLSVWEELSLSKLNPTCMTLELMDRSVSKPIGIAKDVSVKVEVFHFLADFVVVDFEPDPRVPLILRRCFLKTDRALIDVHKDELTLRIGNEAITYNLDQTSRYSANYNQMTANKINVICEVYSQEVLGFSDTTASGNPTPYDDPIVSTTSPTFTSFGDSDFLLFEEADAFLAKTVKSSVNEHPEVELKDLPPHLEYTFLEGDNKFPVIIAKELIDEEKSALIKILIEEDYKPVVQHQRRVNPKIHDVIKKEVEKLFDAGLIYPISDSPWVSPVHRVPKKDGFTVVENEENELILTRLVTGWRGTNSIVSKMVSLGIFKFPLTLVIRRKQRSHVLTERLPIDACLSVCGMHRGRFKDKMLQRCEDTNLSLNWEKSHFMVKEGIVLGHKIYKNENEVDRAKVDVIAKLPHPTTVKDCIKAFQMLKKKLMEAPILIAPNWDLPFELMCDTSTFAIGAVLGQHHKKHFKPIHYASKTMTDAESNYTTTEKEMLFVMLKYGVTHRLSTAYHPQTSGQVEVSNRGLKRILERTIGENRASWSNKLDDALWAFCTAYKTPIGCTPYKLVYGKACHLSIELDHKAYWALKKANFDLAVAGDHRKVKLNELNELHDHAYENSLIYEEKTKRIHDSKIKNRVFNVGDQVLLFNSRLKIFSGKLETRWSRPFTIAKVFPYGTVELSQANGPNFKVNGHRVKHYFRGDVPQLDCPDCEVSRTLSFCLSFTRASHPQLHFGNP